MVNLSASGQNLSETETYPKRRVRERLLKLRYDHHIRQGEIQSQLQWLKESYSRHCFAFMSSSAYGFGSQPRHECEPYERNRLGRLLITAFHSSFIRAPRC